MTALIVIGVILLVFVLIGRIPVGVDASYDGTVFRLAARVWLFSIRLGGKEKKPPKKEKRAKKKKEKEPAEEKSKPKRKLPPLPLLKSLAENGFHMLLRLLSRIRTELLKIHFTAAFPDPAVTALIYGAAGTAMEGLVRAGGKNLRRTDLRAEADFDGGAAVIDARLLATIRIHQILSAGAVFGFGFLRDYLRYKKEDT